MRIAFTGALSAVAVLAQAPQNDTLDIYWIDVEGGASTLVVTPARESILMDAGWPRKDDRDAKRIQAAMIDAEIDHIDYFITSHFHRDHVGGLPALAELIQIDQFIDHGDSVEQDRENGRKLWESYVAVAGVNRRSVKPGDKLPIRRMEFMLVAAHGKTLPQPLSPIAPNVFCDGASPGETDIGENGRSIGYLVSLGAFQFLNLGDLTIDRQHTLACPGNKLGTVDLLQIPHHGNDLAPELLWALGPQVAVSSQGSHKGGSSKGFEVVSQIPRIEDIWQVHRALDTDDAHNTEEGLIANHTDEEECVGHWLKAIVQPDGRSYSVLNGRNDWSRSYLSQ